MAKKKRHSSQTPGNKNKIYKAIGIILLIASLIIHLLLALHFNFTQDDAYITFRYAANYMNGDGLVFNFGEQVEGYTNFLWTIFMILGAILGIEYSIFSKMLGVAFGLMTLVLLFRLALKLNIKVKEQKILTGGLSCLILALMYSFAYWTIAGLETAAFTFFVVAAVFGYAKRYYLSIPALTLAVLMRPEGGLIFGLILIYDLITQRRLSGYCLVTLAGVGIFLLPFATFKLLYYGSLFPNPFYAKTSFNMTQVANGLEYAGRFGWHYLAAGLFLIPGVIAIKKATSVERLIFIIIIVYTVYIILVGGDVLEVHRFFVPIMPLMVIFMVFGLRRLTANFGWQMGAMAIIIIWQLYVPFHYVKTFNQREIDLANKMSALLDRLIATDRSDFSLATSTIGLVSYRLLDHQVIDLLGLTDTTIARHPEPFVEGMESTWKEAQFNCAYVLGRQPDYILFSTGIKPSAPAERALFMYSQFLRNYRTIGYFINNKMRSIYKRYYPIEGEINSDVDIRFAQIYNRAINIWSDGDYTTALTTFDSALVYSPEPKYPYLYYYMANSCLHLNDIPRSYEFLKTSVASDTLIYESLKDLYLYEYRLGNYEAAKKYRAMTAQLVPWYMPRLDALVKKGRK